jgi:hypothetical protein
LERLVIVAVLVVVALAVAAILRRRRPEAPTGAGDWAIPAQLDRLDFAEPEKQWLVVVFTSASCDSCSKATAKAEVLAGPTVAYEVLPWQDRKSLHDRYNVSVVPLTLVADAEGVVVRSFVGVPPATDLWAALA